MMSLELVDAGTRPHLDRLVVPGMDRLTWLEVDCEEDVLTKGTTQARQNEGMRAGTDLEVAPWPLAVPYHAPVDLVDVNEDLEVSLYHHAPGGLGDVPVPAGDIAAVTDPDPVGAPPEGRVKGLASPAEVREVVRTPTGWVRLPFANEVGGTRLGNPLILYLQRALYGDRYRLVLEDQPLFAPFDLREEGRYYAVDDENRFVPMSTVVDLLSQGRRRLYLRPRRWRWSIFVWADYVNATAFELIPNTEVFVKVAWNRPPFYPIRHDVRVSTQSAELWHPYASAYCSYDAGIESQWEASRAYTDLVRQVLEQQFFSLCWSYILLENSDAYVIVDRDPPAAEDVVLGIGWQSGVGQVRVWIIQRGDLSAVYPKTSIGTFYAFFNAG